MRKPLNSLEQQQRVLDILNEHGELRVRDIAAALDLNNNTVAYECLRALRTANKVTLRIQPGKAAAIHYYTAIATHIETRQDSRPKTFGFPVYLHRGTAGAHPIPNQGGQGGITNPHTTAPSEYSVAIKN